MFLSHEYFFSLSKFHSLCVGCLQHLLRKFSFYVQLVSSRLRHFPSFIVSPFAVCPSELIYLSLVVLIQLFNICHSFSVPLLIRLAMSIHRRLQVGRWPLQPVHRRRCTLRSVVTSSASCRSRRRLYVLMFSPQDRRCPATLFRPGPKRGEIVTIFVPDNVCHENFRRRLPNKCN